MNKDVLKENEKYIYILLNWVPDMTVQRAVLTESTCFNGIITVEQLSTLKIGDNGLHHIMDENENLKDVGSYNSIGKRLMEN